MPEPILASMISADSENDQFLMILVWPWNHILRLFVRRAGWRFSDALIFVVSAGCCLKAISPEALAQATLAAMRALRTQESASWK